MQTAGRSNNTARLIRGLSTPMYGRLLADTTRAGEITLLDPDSGDELSRADNRPAFVLSTEAEASDGHIVRQHWDLSRAGSVGIPVLWGHDADRLLGQWQDMAIHSLDDGPALVGRAFLDPETPEAQLRRGQISRGTLNAVSVGWIPGERVRRGDLDSEDPLWREPEDDWCDQPAEGLVMGTQAHPNALMEASLVSVPAQAEAVVTERMHQRAVKTLTNTLRAPSGADFDALMSYMASDPATRAWLKRFIRSLIIETREAPAPAADPLPDLPRTIGDLFPSSGD